jgi:hypothetical protein
MFPPTATWGLLVLLAVLATAPAAWAASATEEYALDLPRIEAPEPPAGDGGEIALGNSGIIGEREQPPTPLAALVSPLVGPLALLIVGPVALLALVAGIGRVSGRRR